MEKEIRYFVTGYEMLLYLEGDREECKQVDYFEFPDYGSAEEAINAARDFIGEHKNAVNDQKYGIGSVTYWVAEVERCIEDEDFGFLSAVGVRPREDSIITDTMFLFKQLMGRRYKLTDAADHIGYEWTGRAHGSLSDALATLAVQEWLESR